MIRIPAKPQEFGAKSPLTKLELSFPTIMFQCGAESFESLASDIAWVVSRSVPGSDRRSPCIVDAQIARCESLSLSHPFTLACRCSPPPHPFCAVAYLKSAGKCYENGHAAEHYEHPLCIIQSSLCEKEMKM